MHYLQGSYPFSETNFQDFSRTFPGLKLIFQDPKIYINPFIPKISVLILLTVCHTYYILNRSLTDFQDFPGPVAFFQDFPVLENATLKFQDFPGFPGPVRTLYLQCSAGLDITTCGVANATGFGLLATNFSCLVASLATVISSYHFSYLFFHFLRSMTK